jgi:hypothetical protein
VTNENDALYVRVYVGSAAGPYTQLLSDRRRDRGLHQRIMSHRQRSVRQGSLKKHEKLLQNPGIRSNWLIMVSFRKNVPKALVHIAHAVMSVMFEACESKSYIACRPDRLPDCPRSWGLNELSLLGQHGLAGYNSIRQGQTKEDAALVRERNVLVGQRRQGSKCQDHYNRLESGGAIHVNVLILDGVIKRFFVTPMTKRDGCHVDITVPRVIGLAYGLQISRSVDIQFDLQSGKDHTHPYAIKAPSASSTRKLGILISGRYACGPQIGDEFEYWIQCNRKEAINKAEILIRKMPARFEAEGSLGTKISHHSQQETRLHDLLNSSPTSAGDEISTQTHNPNSSHSDHQVTMVPTPDLDKEDASHDFDVFGLCLEVLYKLSRKVQDRRIRAMESIRKYLITESLENIAKSIAQAIRPGVVSLLRGADKLELPKKVDILK